MYNNHAKLGVEKISGFAQLKTIAKLWIFPLLACLHEKKIFPYEIVVRKICNFRFDAIPRKFSARL